MTIILHILVFNQLYSPVFLGRDISKGDSYG